MSQQTSQLGKAQLGALWLGSSDATGTIPPFDPSRIPWNVVINSGEPPMWRRRTLESYVAYTVLPQPPVDPSTIAPPQTISDFNQRLTPPWRFRTQESFLTVTYPAFIPTQQINLVNQGLNHRGIGTPKLTGGTQGLQAYIAGVDETSTMLALTCKITRQLGTSGTAEVKFAINGGTTINEGSSIIIVENNRVLFSGIIDDPIWTVYPATSIVEYTLKCVDWNGLMQRHLITQNFPAATLQSIIAGMFLAPTIIADHLSAAGVNSSISTGDEFDFSYVKFSDALTQLTDATNTIWWIDNFKVMQAMLAASAPASAYSVQENGQQLDPVVTVEKSMANYRNKQYIRTTNTILAESVTVVDSHTFTGAAADTGAPTRYPLTSQPFSVTENTGSGPVQLVGTARFFQLNASGPSNYPPPGTTGYYWISGGYGVFAWPTNQPPANGTVLTISYTGDSVYAGNVVVYTDSTEIGVQATRSGGSGIFEEVLDYSGAITYTQALALAQGIEQGTAPTPAVITVMTREIVEDIGYAVTVNLPRWGINGTYVVQQMDLQDMGPGYGNGTRFQRTLQLVSARTLGNFTQYFERLLARLNKAQITAPTEKLSWGLAFDTPGNLSPGLVVGNMGQPLSVQTPQGRILYVSALFANAPDQTIIIDILLNGNSIFDSAKLQYTVGDTGTTILYGNINANSVNVKQGDIFTLDIQQVGTVSPGKNGTVAVVIGAR